MSVKPEGKAVHYQGKKRTPIIRWYHPVLAFFALVFLFSLFSKDKKPRVQYSPIWQDEVNPDIIRALIRNQITGCGQFKYKASLTTRGEYIVLCSPDGINLTGYLVWTPINKVMGPYRPEDLTSP